MPLWLDSSVAGGFSVTVLDFSSTAVEFRGGGVFFLKKKSPTFSIFHSNTQKVERHKVQVDRQNS